MHSRIMIQGMKVSGVCRFWKLILKVKITNVNVIAELNISTIVFEVR
jgi:hypothetical protein